MGINRVDHGVARAGQPAPRSPHQKACGGIYRGGQGSGQGVVRAVVKARSQSGVGLVKAVNPLSQPLRVEKVREEELGTALTGLTTLTTSTSGDQIAGLRDRLFLGDRRNTPPPTGILTKVGQIFGGKA